MHDKITKAHSLMFGHNYPESEMIDLEYAFNIQFAGAFKGNRAAFERMRDKIFLGTKLITIEQATLLIPVIKQINTAHIIYKNILKK